MRSAVGVIHVKPDHADKDMRLLFDNGEQTVRPLVEAFDIGRELGGAELLALQVERLDGTAIRQPVRETLGGVIRLHGANEIFAAINPDVALIGFQSSDPRNSKGLTI